MCCTNSLEIFICNHMNGTKIFIRDRMNSTEVFVHGHTNNHCHKITQHTKVYYSNNYLIASHCI